MVSINCEKLVDNYFEEEKNYWWAELDIEDFGLILFIDVDWRAAFKCFDCF